ncbi:MAG: polysaccharide biosynthesis C-terminal domain-containing protein, partial [Steroidobacterales bacterium]
APYIVMLFLGSKWQAVTPLLQILAFFGITQVLQTNAYSAFLALGKPKAYVQINTIHVIVLIVGLIMLTSRYGLIGAAWAYVIAALLLLPVNFALITIYLGLRPLEFLARLWRPVVAASLMFLCVRQFGPQASIDQLQAGTAAKALTLCIVMGVVTYLSAVAVLWLLSGRPAGAETWAAGLARSVAARLRTST